MIGLAIGDAEDGEENGLTFPYKVPDPKTNASRVRSYALYQHRYWLKYPWSVNIYVAWKSTRPLPSPSSFLCEGE